MAGFNDCLQSSFAILCEARKTLDSARVERAFGRMATSLAADKPILICANSKDVAYDDLFAREVETYGDRGGVLLAISTSAHPNNVIAAVDWGRPSA